MINVGDTSNRAACLQREWETSQRWTGIQREHSAGDVIRLRGSIAADHALARRGARQLWELLGREDVVQAGRQAIYLSGRRASAMVRETSQAMVRTDQTLPIVADAQAGPGREDAFNLMSAMIEAGAAGVHFEDRLPLPTEHGDPGARVLIPTGEHIKTLSAARLAADVLNVPALVIARTYAHGTSLLSSGADERDQELLTGERTAAGLHLMQPGLYPRVTRALAFAPYADLLWLETSTPDLAVARAFADIIYSQHPGKPLAYSCSPAFDWAGLDDAPTAQFQDALAALGYRFQLTTTTGSHPSRDPAPAPAAPQEEAQLATSAL